jgi:hypothetical protein
MAPISSYSDVCSWHLYIQHFQYNTTKLWGNISEYRPGWWLGEEDGENEVWSALVSEWRYGSLDKKLATAN